MGPDAHHALKTLFSGQPWALTSAGQLHVATSSDAPNELFSYDHYTGVTLHSPPSGATEVCCLNCAVWFVWSPQIRVHCV